MVAPKDVLAHVEGAFLKRLLSAVNRELRSIKQKRYPILYISFTPLFDTVSFTGRTRSPFKRKLQSPKNFLAEALKVYIIVCTVKPQLSEPPLSATSIIWMGIPPTFPLN